MQQFKYEPFDIDYDITSTENDKGERHYSTPDGVFPSVTTVINATSDKSAIEAWRKRIGEEKADRITRQCARFGTRVHEFLETMIKEGHPPKATYDVLTAWQQLKPDFEKNLGIVHGLEVPLWSKLIGVAGRTDCFGYWNGIPSLIDFKTSRSTKRREWITNYFIQGVLYSVMIQERFDFEIKQIVLPIFSIRGESNVFTARISEYYDPARRVLEQFT